jgi:O-antigen ligase
MTGAILAIWLAIFLLLSFLWSGNPQSTISQGTVYLFAVVGAIGIASNLETDEFMKLVAGICGWAAFCSLVLAVVMPSAVYSAEGDFRGICSQKNVLGKAMMVGALASLHGIRASKRHEWHGYIVLITVTIACFLSKSTTSLTTILMFCSTSLVSNLMRRGGVARILGFAVAFLAAAMASVGVVFQDAMLEMMGKDPTLTGRTEIWGYVISDIYQKPLLGWGYNGFWFLDNPAAAQIDDAVHWFVPQAHNGLLEILLSVGLVGAVFFLFVLGRNIILGIGCRRTSETALAMSSLLCCASIVFEGISEIVLLSSLEGLNLMFFVTGFYCERTLRLRQQRFAASERYADNDGQSWQVATHRTTGADQGNRSLG